MKLLRWHPAYGWIPLAGALLLAAWVPLIPLPSLRGAQVVFFIVCFGVALLAYIFALRRLQLETPPLWLVWGFALAFRLALLATPTTLSDDVYRYIWDGHLLGLGVNPYAQVVLSPGLDAYATPLRGLVNFPMLATPYLPAAQAYFALVERIAPQTPRAFQLAAVVLDLSTAGLLALMLPRLRIPPRAILIYLWNPLVIVEFAHGAHVDALMLFLLSIALWALVCRPRSGRTLSVLALAASVLVKGWPILLVPLLVQRWGFKRLILFGLSLALPLAFFALGPGVSGGAGWGLSGPLDGRGVFGTLRVYAVTWNYNGGLYLLIARGIGSAAARLIAVLAPGLLSVVWGWQAWRERDRQQAADPAVLDRRLLRRTAQVLSVYLLLASTVHPWYLTLVIALFPFFWPQDGETDAARRWLWPWLYFIFFEVLTYIAFSGIRVRSTEDMHLAQLIGYIPLWLLFIWAAMPGLRKYAVLNKG